MPKDSWSNRCAASTSRRSRFMTAGSNSSLRDAARVPRQRRSRAPGAARCSSAPAGPTACRHRCRGRERSAGAAPARSPRSTAARGRASLEQLGRRRLQAIVVAEVADRLAERHVDVDAVERLQLAERAAGRPRPTAPPPPPGSTRRSGRAGRPGATRRRPGQPRGTGHAAPCGGSSRRRRTIGHPLDQETLPQKRLNVRANWQRRHGRPEQFPLVFWGSALESGLGRPRRAHSLKSPCAGSIG